MGIEYEVRILRPVEAMFTIASNPSNLPRYDTNIIEVKPINQEEIGVGMEYQVVAFQFGRRMTVDLEIIAYESNNEYAFRVNSGTFPVETQYKFVSQGHSTKIIGERKPQPGGIWKVLVLLM